MKMPSVIFTFSLSRQSKLFLICSLLGFQSFRTIWKQLPPSTDVQPPVTQPTQPLAKLRNQFPLLLLYLPLFFITGPRHEDYISGHVRPLLYFNYINQKPASHWGWKRKKLTCMHCQ